MNKLKNFNQLFENQNKKLIIGDKLFHHFEDGINFEDLLEPYNLAVISDDGETLDYEFLYEINDFKIMVLNGEELYLLYHDYIHRLNSAFHSIFQSFFVFAEPEDKKIFMDRMNDYADIIIIYNKFKSKTLNVVKDSVEYKKFIRNKQSKKFKI